MPNDKSAMRNFVAVEATVAIPSNVGKTALARSARLVLSTGMLVSFTTVDAARQSRLWSFRAAESGSQSYDDRGQAKSAENT